MSHMLIGVSNTHFLKASSFEGTDDPHGAEAWRVWVHWIGLDRRRSIPPGVGDCGRNEVFRDTHTLQPLKDEKADERPHALWRLGRVLLTA